MSLAPASPARILISIRVQEIQLTSAKGVKMCWSKVIFIISVQSRKFSPKSDNETLMRMYEP